METVNRWFLFMSLGKIRSETKGKRKVVFVTCPQQTCVLQTVHEDQLYYECCDLYSKRPGLSPAAERRIEKKEKFLVSQCDLIATTSKELFDRMAIRNVNTYYIPNSADTQLYETAMISDLPIPDDLTCIPKPWVGLIGYISELVDMDLLTSLADRHPEWSFIVIGNMRGRISRTTRFKINRFMNLPNVYMLGYKPYDIVPVYQKFMDVCLICYKLNEYTDCIHPNKLSQYLSQNKNIVSTAIKELTHYSGSVRIGRTLSEFESGVAEAIRDGDRREMSRAARNYLSENTMEKSSIRRLELICGHLNVTSERASNKG